MTEKDSPFGAEKEPDEIDKEKVRQLNDLLRITFIGGQVVLTQGVAQLPAVAKSKILRAIQTFDDFNQENDPYGEHDMGIVEVDGVKAYWKIDYYDKKYEYHSPAKDDPEVTNRVLTIMKPEEY